VKGVCCGGCVRLIVMCDVGVLIDFGGVMNGFVSVVSDGSDGCDVMVGFVRNGFVNVASDESDG